MIYTHIAYASNECKKNIGCAYNKFMEMLPNDEDWGCFLDHDAMFTTSTWYTQIEKVINENPKIGAFTCRTNRVGCWGQWVRNVDIDNHCIKYHRKVGLHLQKKYNVEITNFGENVEPLRGFSGVFMLVKKKTWKTINGFKDFGFLGVDNDFRQRLIRNKIKLYVMDGVYVYHWYKADKLYDHSLQKLEKYKIDFNRNGGKNISIDQITKWDINLWDHWLNLT